MKKRIKPKPDNDADIARFVGILRGLPFRLVREMTVGQMKTAFDLQIGTQTIYITRKRFVEAGDRSGQRSAVSGQADGSAIVLERLARIISKTYAHLGDGELIASEDALRLMLAEIKSFDPSLITRNEKRSIRR